MIQQIWNWIQSWWQEDYREWETGDWLIEENLNGEPLSITGTACGRLSERQEREILFRRCFDQRISPTLEELDDPFEKIRFLHSVFDQVIDIIGVTFVHFLGDSVDVTTRREGMGPGVEYFLSGLNERLRETYRSYWKKLEEEADEMPAGERIPHLEQKKEEVIEEMQGEHAPPAVDRFVELVDSTIKLYEIEHRS